MIAEEADHRRFALVRQAINTLLSLCDPDRVANWKPTDEQKRAYSELIERVFDHVGAIRSSHKESLQEGRIQNFVPDWFKNEVEPRLPSFSDAYELLNPGHLILSDIDISDFLHADGRERVKDTFEVGIQRIYDLINNNPDVEYGFDPDEAYRALDSKLIRFEPDAWLRRLEQLRPVTLTRHADLPAHLRFRLEEVFRAYVFGSWLSVLALSRSILEYGLLDNLSKFRIDSEWPSGQKDGKRREKSLEQLITDVTNVLPQLATPMHRIRLYGNDYLHPRPSRASKESLFQREQAAKAVIDLLVPTLEALYLSRCTTT